MKIICNYVDEETISYESLKIHIYEKEEGEFTILTNHRKIKGKGNKIYFDNILIEKNFLFFFEKNILQVYFI